MMNEFVKIPSSIIQNKSLGEKRIIIFASIMVSGWDGKDINSLVRYSKYSECRDKADVFYQYKELIQLFIEFGLISKTDRGYGLHQTVR